MENITSDVKNKMQKTLEVLISDFATVRTGKASPALIENIMIDAYPGSAPLRLMELATIHAQDAKTLIISPFDASIISQIERSISNSNVGMNPIVDQQVLRINLPPLSEERRTEFVKVISQKAEHGKVMLRQIRHEAINSAKKRAEQEGISEDEIERIEKEVQRVTDEYILKIDEISEQKEQELMTI